MKEPSEIRSFAHAIAALAQNCDEEIGSTVERLANGTIDRAHALEQRATKISVLLSYLEEELKNRRPELTRCRDLIAEAKKAYL